MSPDETLMQLALDEARRGLGCTSPNPAVGAVIVRQNEVLARGYHHRAGAPHAEIEALNALADPALARGATIFVTLEPCSTHGRTPPCVDAIIRAGLSRVVVGAIDPNPRHAGAGLELLRAAGLQVSSGILEEPCRDLNAPFNKWIVTGMPWVIAKAGLSLDGRLTRPPGEGQWLTSEAARDDAHRVRARADAILIGANTLRHDNPRLTIRGPAQSPEKAQPWRVILTTGQNPLPPEAHLFSDEHRARTLVFRGQSLQTALASLAKEQQVTCVLIEGGMRVLGEAFDQRLVDEVCFYLAPLLCGGPVVAIGGRGAPSTVQAPEIVRPEYHRIEPDLRMTGRVCYREEDRGAG